MRPILKNAFINAVSTALYVMAVASFLFYVPKKLGPADSVLVPITFLLLFVFSAAFTSMLFFGRPVVWYLEGSKKEALSLIAYTLLIFLLITTVALLCLLFYLAH